MAGTRHCYVGAPSVATPAYQLFVQRDSKAVHVDVETYNHDHGAFAPLLEHLAVARVFRGLPDGCSRAACAHLDVLPAVLMQVSADTDGQASTMVVVTPGFVGAFTKGPKDGAVEAFVTCPDPRAGADPAKGGVVVLVCTHTVFLVTLGVSMPRSVIKPATTVPGLGLARAVFDFWADPESVAVVGAAGQPMPWDPARFHFPMVPPRSSPLRPLQASPSRPSKSRPSRPPPLTLPSSEDEADEAGGPDDVQVRLVPCRVLDNGLTGEGCPLEEPPRAVAAASVWQHSSQ